MRAGVEQGLLIALPVYFALARLLHVPLSGAIISPWIVLLALTMAQVGMISMIGPFWSLSTSFLSGIGAVGGIALINTLANTGGAFSSPLMSKLEKVTGSFAAGQMGLGMTMLAGAGIALIVRHDPAADRTK